MIQGGKRLQVSRFSPRVGQRSTARTSLVVRGSPMQELMKRMGGGEGAIERGDKPKGGEGKLKVAWKYDPAMNRWVKDNKPRETWDSTMELPTVTTATGDTYTIWPAIWAYLTEKNLRSVSPSEALAMVESGKALIVDVRKPRSFQRQRIVGSVNLPLFKPIENPADRMSQIKKIAVSLLNMEATERNKNFRQEALEQLPKNKVLIVACDLGGTLSTEVLGPPRSTGDKRKVCKNDPDRAFGRESRSLKACFELMEAGFPANKIYHLEGGIPQWRYDGLEMEEN